jgi:hypothetical protein
LQPDARIPVGKEEIARAFGLFYENLKKYNKAARFTSDDEVKAALASLGFKDPDAGKAWAEFRKWHSEASAKGTIVNIPAPLLTELRARHAVFFTLEPVLSYLPPEEKKLGGEAVVEKDQVKLLAFLKRLDTNTVLSAARFSQVISRGHLQSYCNDAALRLSGLKDLILKNETPSKVEKIDVSTKKPLKANGTDTTFVFFSEAVNADGSPLREVLSRGYNLAVRCRFGTLRAKSTDPETQPGSFIIVNVRVTKTLDMGNIIYRAPKVSDEIRKAGKDTIEVFSVSSLDGATIIEKIGSAEIPISP